MSIDTRVGGKWLPASIAEHRDDPVISVSTAYALRGWGGERHWTELLVELPTSALVDELIARRRPIDLNEDVRFVGVQVRAHPRLAHPLTLEKSPVAWFVDRMRQIRMSDPSVRFFLSCDTREAEETIAAAVPGVFHLTKEGKYNSRDGLIEAVADLRILSRASHLLAPHQSSFAVLAWEMGRRSMPFETSQVLKAPRS